MAAIAPRVIKSFTNGPSSKFLIHYFLFPFELEVLSSFFMSLI